FFQAEDGIRDRNVTGVQTCALPILRDEEKGLVNELESYKTKFINAMEDDLNTADAVSAIFELSKFINTNVNETSSLEFAKMCLDKFNELTGVLNIVKDRKSTRLNSSHVSISYA